MRYLLKEELALSAKFATQFVKQAHEDRKGSTLRAAILALPKKVKTAQDILQPVLD